MPHYVSERLLGCELVVGLRFAFDRNSRYRINQSFSQYMYPKSEVW